MTVLYVVLAVVVVLSAVVVGTRRRRRRARPALVAPARAAMPEILVSETAPMPSLERELSLNDRLASSRGVFERVRSIGGTSELSTDQLEVVEEVLLRSDVGVTTTNAVLEELRTKGAPDGVVAALRTILLGSFSAERSTTTAAGEGRVAVWLFVGVNGVGKTTTIGKLAKRHHDEGRSVMLAAGDTFRAAAADQLEQWATRTSSDIVRADEGADPGSVVHDAVGRASARGVDLVLADTAGRRANSTNLLDELSKVRRVADRAPGQVVETLLVLDATTGQNALSQAREFLAASSVTGIVLTKLDGTARGGIVVAIERDLGIPVKFVGVGEGVDDLIVFEPEVFVDSLLGA
ncbi:MAG TPA: signal recognition particle-docking protein FtsY [Acidimicrobiales bacterium]|nr:signal recognition particle-docking protein FtsY [Acidimicrobiales bacterium]